MQFKLFTLATVFLSAGSAHAQTSNIAAELTQITQSLTGANANLQPLNISNASVQIPAIISDLTGIASDVTSLGSVLVNGTLPTAVVQAQICATVATLNGAYEILVTSVQAKLSIWETLGLGSIIAEVLSTALTQVDSVERKIIALVPICGVNATATLTSLEATLGVAIKGFGGTVPAL